MGTRRRFILGSLAAAGALVVGWSFIPMRQRLNTGEPLPEAAGEKALNGWVKVASDGAVTVMVPKSEMGQGIHTALAMILAEELDADWAKVRVAQAPIDPIYFNIATTVDGLPFHPDSQSAVKRLAEWFTAKSMREMGLMMTGGSSSVKDLWMPLRQAGASARAMLVAAAAAQWKVAPGEIAVANGKLSHASGKSAGFGELVQAAAALPVPSPIQLKAPTQFKLIGHATPRLEAGAKVEGRAGFGLDVRLPGMLYATVKWCPILGGRLASFSGSKALAMPGVKGAFVVDAGFGSVPGVAVLATSTWQALRAIEAVEAVWDEAVPTASLSSTAVMAQLNLQAQSQDPAQGFAYYSHGDAAGALKGAARSITALYSAPYLAHAPMEPMSCTVQLKDGKATVWASTQVPDLARRAAAKALGLHARSVQVNVQYLGGGFGRRLEVDFIAVAAAIAKQAPAGVPVQTVFSRAQDVQHDFYRPACAARYTAGFDAKGQLLGITALSAGQAILPQVLRRLFGLPWVGPDKTTAEGAFDQPYAWPTARIAHERVELPVPVGFWRSVGHSHQAFFKESFVDEMAAANQTDPVAFRQALLKGHPRHARVLALAAEKAGWGQPLANGGLAPDGAKIARGVALHQSFGSTVAQVVEVSVAADKTIRVHRVVCAIDCGTAVNPGHIAQQMESAVVFGLSAALYGGITIEKGRVQQSNFHDAPVLRINACPEVETHIVPSTEHPQGVGEPGLPPLAPAVANAVFALTGQRLRSLPLKLA